MRILLLRPPRYVWPFNSETSAFWQPLGLLCLAAAVLRDMPGAQVEVWDCPGQKCGWRTLEQRLAAERIDVLGVGEETVSAHEAIRAAALVKRLWPDCVVVAGGVYFAHAIEGTLGASPKSAIPKGASVRNSKCAAGEPGSVDVIVRGEGEATFVELLRNLHDRARWATIPGIAFRDSSGGLVITPARPLIEDMDALPMPAYVLLDMSLYGRSSRNHPALVSVEHSRGCTDNCNFCILWKQMGSSIDNNGRVRPVYRTKSAQRSFEEVAWLHRRFGRRTFGWVDPTFNGSPAWSDRWAELMLCSDMMDGRGQPRTLHTAWVRADGIIRDQKLGVLDKLVRAGLRQVMIGVERDDAAGLAALGKHNNSADVSAEAFAILRERHPKVYTIGTMIFGLPGDTREDLMRLVDCQYRMGMDYCFIMPLTPNPGTAVAENALREGLVANEDLASYNFHTPVCRTESMGLRELESVYWRLSLKPGRRRAAVLLAQMFRQRDRRKRRVNMALFRRGTAIAARSFLRAILHPGDRQPTLYSRRPSWYDD
ncbi:MAG: radical SAM protein [Phycisphaerae bacterium]